MNAAEDRLAFLLGDPPYLALIFGEGAIFGKKILRSSFVDPSLMLRSTLLVGVLLYLGVGLRVFSEIFFSCQF